jgi:hypothetical protein
MATVHMGEKTAAAGYHSGQKRLSQGRTASCPPAAPVLLGWLYQRLMSCVFPFMKEEQMEIHI